MDRLKSSNIILDKMVAAQNRIELFKNRTGWNARFSGPHAAEIKRLFEGSDTLPLPYTTEASPAMVLAEQTKLNPKAVVTLKDGQ
jgi:hypothetical protein